MKQKKNRSCGILIHPTSFDSPYGVGDMGKEARAVLRMIADAGCGLWQILPLGPTGYGDSPYSSCSCFAGNENLIDLRQIEGFDESEEDFAPEHSKRVDYTLVYEKKWPLLFTYAQKWYEAHSKDAGYEKFCSENSFWLDDYALYRALCRKFGDSRWFMWPEELKKRRKEALQKYSKELEKEIIIFKVLQFFFDSQWKELRKYANSIGLKIIGDIPIFVSSDSVDAWTNPHLFKLDSSGNQTAQAGVPPDAFSPTGQLWGNPVYNWKEHKKDNYLWWRKRLEQNLKRVDIVRIDHFRGFESYWEVPAGDTTAENGKWVKGPGMDLLKNFKDCNMIAEDLGVITKEVETLLEETGWPGMKVLQFAFDLNSYGELKSENPYLPHNYGCNCIAYSGTHDNQTSRGWFNGLSDSYKDIVRRYLQCPDEDVVWQMIRSLVSSSADTVVIPMQDWLGLDDSARMNVPSTVSGCNWSWRFDRTLLQDWQIKRLKEFNKLYGRF